MVLMGVNVSHNELYSLIIRHTIPRSYNFFRIAYDSQSFQLPSREVWHLGGACHFHRDIFYRVVKLYVNFSKRGRPH